MKKLLAIYLAALLCLPVVLFTGCSSKDTGPKLYFTNTSHTRLETEKFKQKDSGDAAAAIVTALLEGPKDKELQTAIPKETKLLGVSSENGQAIVNLSDQFYNTQTLTDEVLARYQVAASLCSLPDVDSVKIFVSGMPLVDNATKEQVGVLSDKDMVDEQGIQDSNDTVQMTLYFAQKGTNYLDTEKRVVSLKENDIVERVILNELISGPTTENLVKTIPADTKVLSVETKDSVCYVNLSREFIDKFSGTQNEELLAVYSIVNSLTELKNIKSVQFLVKGEKVEMFGHVIFNEPFTKDDAIVAPSATPSPVTEAANLSK